ncbi:hypothetical protein, partial [Bernardetia sp.]|uniref:hypothetical protein n=1 Tax=Bernardetia sp. TaxID=1937974 RepID=UPI0025BA3F9D
YNNRFNSMEFQINSEGNHPRDRVIQDTVQMGEKLLDAMFTEGKIENNRILPFLHKYYYSERGDTEKFLRKLKEYKGNNQIVKQVNLVSRYQTSLYYLYNHYNKLGSASPMRLTETLIMNVNDTTLGLAFMGLYDNYILEPQNKVWWMTDDSKNLIGIKVETYIKGDTIEKMYKVTPQKNGKPNPFDYEKIDFD